MLLMLHVGILPASAQAPLDTQRIHELKVGDMMPNIKFTHSANFPAGIKNFSDLRGKLVILDYWNAGCTSCFRAFPRMDSLQKQFQGQLIVIAVNPRETQELAETYLKRANKESFKANPDLHLPSLATVYDDLSWITLFPSSQNAYPFHVWINKDGKVISLTEPVNATAENIKKVLIGENPQMVQRTHVNFDYKEHPLLEAKEGISSPYFYSAFFPFQDGLGSRLSLTAIDSVNQTYRIAFTNLPAYELYDIAYHQYHNHILVQTSDSTNIYRPDNFMEWSDDIMKKNCFTYELCIPLKDKGVYKKYMQADLNRFFEQRKGLHAVEKVADVKCWVLRTKNISLLNIKSNVNNAVLPPSKTHHGNVCQLSNAKIGDLTFMLSYFLQSDFHSPYSFINETGLKNEIFDIAVDLTSPATIRSSLEKSGLELSYEPRKQKILSIESITAK